MLFNGIVVVWIHLNGGNYDVSIIHTKWMILVNINVHTITGVP